MQAIAITTLNPSNMTGFIGHEACEATNRARWDERAAAHAKSPDYKVDRFIHDTAYVGDVVEFDRRRLGDITGLNCIHLQCALGTGTLGLARLGAASVTGLDFSAASVDEARNLARATTGSGGDRLAFVVASVYDSLKVVPPQSFDLVFTGIGSLNWLPSVERWAKVVAGLLKPGGRFFMREMHPMLVAVDYEREDGVVIKYPYFERPEPTEYDDPGSHIDTNGQQFATTKGYEYSHGVGEVVQALIDQGLRITALEEHQSSPWNALPTQMQHVGRGEFALTDQPWRMAHSYTLQALKEEK
ncbi:hypothetical protein G6O67_000652 [Ophiocordyceps sinensis]|uniref:Methyltransferase domain-containing protein n=1 Tax=Ophiocordyceps sinensis TaxID=72228 RepID=A0A8H4PZM9_9HYPO|nr:hypothetical protein G6O67_000652 [Ophiocordyceps sinensis]